MNEPRCDGCYRGFTGWWCDNCDQWPCICSDEEDEGSADDTPLSVLVDIPESR